MHKHTVTVWLRSVIFHKIFKMHMLIAMLAIISEGYGLGISVPLAMLHVLCVNIMNCCIS